MATTTYGIRDESDTDAILARDSENLVRSSVLDLYSRGRTVNVDRFGPASDAVRCARNESELRGEFRRLGRACLSNAVDLELDVALLSLQ